MLKIFLDSGNILIHPSALIKKSVYEEIGLYDNRLNQIPDFEYWVRMCCNGYTIKVLPEKLIKYRFRENELNTSNGNREDVSNRLIFEYQFLLKNYFNLKINDISKIFKIPDEYKDITEKDREFVIAQLIFRQNNFGNLYKSIYRLTALNKLFEIINDKEKNKYLEKKHNFSYVELIKQSGEYQLLNSISEEEITNFKKFEILKNELDQIKNSKSWKITNKILIILYKYPRIKQIIKLFFLFVKKIIYLTKKNIIVLNEIIRNISYKKIKIKKLPKGVKIIDIVNINNYKNNKSKYLCFLDKNEKINKDYLELLSYIADSNNLDIIFLQNKRTNNTRCLIKNSSIKKEKPLISHKILDDNHILPDWSNKYIFPDFINNKIISKKIFPYSAINPYVNLNKKTNKKNVLFVFPFILDAPHHLLNKLVEIFYQNKFNNYIVGTENIYPNYLKVGDGYKNYIKYSNSISYLYELLPKFLWRKYFHFLLELKNIKTIINTGSPFFYKEIKEIKKYYPKIKIIDIQFNDYGHIKEHFDNITNIDITIVESKSMKNFLLKKGEAENKIKIIPNGTNLDMFNKNIKLLNEINRKKFDIDKNKFIVSFLGRLSEEKKPNTIIEIAKKLERYDDILIIIAGDGPLKSDLENLIELKKIKNVKILGYQNPIDIISISDINILTSVIDGSPMSIKECMACGVPIISSNVGGIPELIINNKNGYLLKYWDIDGYVSKILLLKNNINLYKKISENAYLFASKYFDEKKLLKKYIDIVNNNF